MCYANINSRREYKAFAQFIINGVNLHKNDDLQLKFFKEGLRNQIFDMAVIYTGYTSKKAIETGLPKSKLTEEHIHPRNQSAKRLIQYVLDGMGVNDLAEMVKQFCQVHITTKEENTSLVQYQKQPDYNWQDGYRAVGIELVEHQFTRIPKFVYKVDGIEYNNLKEIAEKFGIHQDTARNRFKSKTEKFKGWTRHEVLAKSATKSG